jgi:hypothetical protein
MEALFKFMMIRPAEGLDADKDAVALQASPETIRAVNAALTSREDTASALRAVGERILASAAAVSGVDADPMLKSAADCARQITANTTVAQARKLVETLFGAPTRKVADASANMQVRVSDTLVALKYLGRTDARTDDLAAAYRVLAYVKLLAATLDDTVVPKPGAFLARTLTIAGATRPARPVPVPVGGATVQQLPDDPRDGLRLKAKGLEQAIGELTRMGASALSIATPAGATAPGGVPNVPRLAGASPQPATGTALTTPAVGAPAGSPPVIIQPAAPSVGPAATLVGPNAALRLAVLPAAIQALSPATQTMLRQESVVLDKVALPDAVDQLSRSLRETATQLATLEQAASPQARVVRFGSSVYEISPIVIGLNMFPKMPFSVTPTTHGDLKPVGIGDLLVVKQNLKRYDAHDLSDVVNVMKGEHRSTETKRTHSLTTTDSTEVASTQEDERDQQTAERFEMQTETSNVQKSEESVKLGASVSASYGPFVTFKASADYGMANSKEQSAKVATNYSKEVTSKASSKITQSFKKLHSTVDVQTFGEDNVHEWDNAKGDDHVVGQYQYLDKVYEAQVYNYGKRLLFDTTIPEPAAFLYWAQTMQPPAGYDLVKPAAFTLRPEDLNEGNYGFYVQRHGAVGVEAPPEPFVTVAKTFDGADDRTNRGELTKIAELPVPEGYQAVAASVYASFSNWDSSQAYVDIAVGSAAHRWTHAGGVGFWNTSMNNETSTVPFALFTFRVAMIASSVEIRCARTERKMHQWKLSTHAAIRQAYDKQMRDYEDALAEAQNRAANEAHGISPEANAQLIRDEMKRLTLTLLTNQQFDMFNAVATGPYGYPQMDNPVAEAQGAYIRFFEEAFEWQEMMYLFYPYYWAHKSSWQKRVLFSDDDPQFEAFLKAGAARVVVSVRPGFEKAVAHFMETGQIWDGGDPPTITDPAYLSIIDEIKDQQGASQGELAQGDPWDVPVPTSLIKLRLIDTLPEWKKDPSGAWIAAN